MVEEAVKSNLAKIFGVKVTFDRPDDIGSPQKGNREQDVLFVELTENVCRISPTTFRSRATGTMHIYSQNEKLPSGFLSKRIEQAAPELIRPFFFYHIEESATW